MPYSTSGKNYGRRRRPSYKRKPRKPQSTKSMLEYVHYIPKIMKTVGRMQSMINSERKYVDITDSSSPSNTGTINLVNQIAQGDDVNQRDGNSILCSYIKHRMVAKINTTATSTSFRILLVLDTANQGTTPAVADILQTVSTTSNINVDNSKRFWFLYDKLTTLDINGDRSWSCDELIPVNKHMRYSASGQTTVLQNAIYHVMVSDEATLTPTTASTTRVAFYDN